MNISNREVMLKNKSFFRRSTGDQAGCAPKKGIATNRNMGKVFFSAWSMDVRVEGENVVRHLDLTTHNHGSYPGNTGPWPYLDAAAVEQGGACKTDADAERKACSGFEPHGTDDLCDSLLPVPYSVKPRYAASNKPSGSRSDGQAELLAKHHAASDCMNKRRCFLMPYRPKAGVRGCCPPQTGHHLIEASALFDVGRGGVGSSPLQGVTSGTYNENDAPCVCAEGINQNTGSHGWMHTFQSLSAMNMPIGTPTLATGTTLPPQPMQTYKQAKATAYTAMQKVFPKSRHCTQQCIEAQIDNYHQQCGLNDNTMIKAVIEGQTSPEAVQAAQAHLAEIAPGWLRTVTQTLANIARSIGRLLTWN